MQGDLSSRAHTAPQRINAERLMLLAWSRAMLLQFAHPLIAAGVYEHSGFRDSPIAAARRLKNTVRAMLALSFGADSEREQTIARIRAIHRRVHGTLHERVGPFAPGTPYSAEDPSLVLWVHATLIASVPAFYELLVQPLDPIDYDAYCAHAAPIAIALGARPSDVPRTRRDLDAYVASMHRSGHLAVSSHARELAARVLMPFGALGRPAAFVNRVLTVGTLPPDIRDAFALEWTARDRKRFDRVVSALRLLRRGLPDRAATWGAAHRKSAAAP